MGLAVLPVPRPDPPLFTAVQCYATKLESSLEQVSAIHREAAGELASWISNKLARGENANVTVICTGNSRRSEIGRFMMLVARKVAESHKK